MGMRLREMSSKCNVPPHVIEEKRTSYFTLPANHLSLYWPLPVGWDLWEKQREGILRGTKRPIACCCQPAVVLEKGGRGERVHYWVLTDVTSSAFHWSVRLRKYRVGVQWQPATEFTQPYNRMLEARVS